VGSPCIGLAPMAGMISVTDAAKYSKTVLEQTSRSTERNGVKYSMADQVARFANAKATNDARYLDITTVCTPELLSQLKGMRVLITGAEQGLGFELVKEIVAQGGHAVQAGRTSSKDLDDFAAANPGAVTVITGVDVCKSEAMAKMADELGEGLDILINCAGYFYGPAESVGVGCEGHMNYVHQLLQIDVCALGPLRITHALYKAGKLQREGKPPAKVIIITSQAGSCEWRFTQNPTPKPGEEFHGNYGHHMSRAACNIMGCILSQELKAADIPVQMLHPGFNRTAMTQKYAHIWDIEGAVEPHIGCKRVLYETLKADMSTTGTVINCEDGLRIPW